MLLYRELDNLANRNDLDAALAAYRSRLKDRFGDIPEVAEELIRVVPLRAYGKQLGIEKIMLKQQKMYLYFVSNADSPYYQSEQFGTIIDYVSWHPRETKLREVEGRRSVVVSGVKSIIQARQILQAMLSANHA
jgi:transcription-repair coupling factor (superfamily II helicase)